MLPATPRTRTPTDLKWLLNERAAIAGDIAALTVRQKTQVTKRERMALQLERAKSAHDATARHLNSKQATLAALDASLALAYKDVEPSAAGIVHAWAGRYGKRGALTAFLLEKIRDAAPATMTTTLLIDLAIRHFGLITELMPTDRAKFRRTVAKMLILSV